MKKSLSLFLILLCFIHFTSCFHSLKKEKKDINKTIEKKELKRHLINQERKKKIEKTENYTCYVKFADNDNGIFLGINDLIKKCTITDRFQCSSNKTDSLFPYDLQDDIYYISSLNCNCIVTLFHQDNHTQAFSSYIPKGVSRNVYEANKKYWKDSIIPSNYTSADFRCFPTTQCD